MFDIGWLELLLIAAVAIVVVGPKDLPRMMRTFGQYMGRARAMAREFQRSFEDIARESELDELRKEMRDLRRQADLSGDLEKAGSERRTTASEKGATQDSPFDQNSPVTAETERNRIAGIGPEGQGDQADSEFDPGLREAVLEDRDGSGTSGQDTPPPASQSDDDWDETIPETRESEDEPHIGTKHTRGAP